jgi:pSer/pThr/pTyr-binding forkhead associated (FHA) protein
VPAANGPSPTMGSRTNGTFLNGARLHGRQRLRDGDRLLVGGTVVLYRVGSGSAHVAVTVVDGTMPTVEELSATQRRVLVALCR